VFPTDFEISGGKIKGAGGVLGRSPASGGLHQFRTKIGGPRPESMGVLGYLFITKILHIRVSNITNFV
jgi:hypothetical protein